MTEKYSIERATGVQDHMDSERKKEEGENGGASGAGCPVRERSLILARNVLTGR